MSLERYIKDKYEGSYDWFVDEVQQGYNIDKVNNCIDIAEYIDGKHNILKRPDTLWKGKVFKTRKIILQYIKPILTFQNSFLLKNPVTLTSEDKETLETYKEVYKVGKYNILDSKILDSLLKYGEVFEYIYIDDDKKIKSKLIKAIDGFPVINSKGEYIALIEHFISDGISYYIVYDKDVVREYNDVGGDLHLTGEYDNISGLPIHYILPSEVDEYIGRSDLLDWVGIVDNMEDLLSKYMDSFYKFLNPMPIMTGTKLATGTNGEGAIPSNVAGHVLQLDFNSTFDYAIAKMDYQSFKEIYQTLHQNLLNISMTPSISMNSTEISNLSETSMRILFYMAIAKASMTSKQLKMGFDERFKKIYKVLKFLGNKVEGYVDCTFKFDIPSNDKEIIENLKNLKEMGTMSLETLLSQSPYIYDVSQELQRLKGNEGK